MHDKKSLKEKTTKKENSLPSAKGQRSVRRSAKGARQRHLFAER
jgi:hypothetical protein